ncbi:MAG: VWA domain-containing protein [Deltaproteobacteria bacterium]|nr:VWA domain-containing protein [Deltaproteobacteria bacterium]
MGLDDWDQRLFSFVWKGARALGRQLGLARDVEQVLPAHGARLADLAPRLRLLAAALAGSDLEVREAESFAGYRGDTILLPRSVAVGTTEAEGVDVYVLGLSYQLMCRRLGFRLPSEAKRPETASWLAMAVALPLLSEELPGSREVLNRSKALLLEARPAPSALTGAACALELSLRELLAEPSAPCDQPGALTWNASLREAAAVVSASPGETLAQEFDCACARLEASLRALGEPFDVPPLLPFGLLREAAPDNDGQTTTPLPASALASGTEHEGKAHEAVRRVQLDDRPVADNPLVHSFEKVHTAEEYRGGQKALDGSDELDDQLEALEELDIREVIRTRERTESIFRADALLDGAAPELSDATPTRPPDYTYDEWDGKRREYRREHCNLYLERTRPVRPAAAAKWVKETRASRRRELRRLEQQLSRIELERRPKKRRRDGAEVDVDAVVDARATLAAGHTPSDRLYIERKPGRPALSLLVLLDLSLSSDAYVAGERVLDVSREAAFVVGEALGESVDFAIAGFHSNTRRDCRFVSIKAFGEAWTQARGRLAGLEPQGYTRVGAALRHGTNVLRHKHTRRKALVVVTDGQPTDYDRYEGRHGVEDVAQAVREARRDGVACFALAVSKERTAQLGQMFGHDRYSLLHRADQLPEAMSLLMTELLRR